MSENIPYIIAEDGYYYVAYKEKVKVPEIVVSSKGIANGLSEEYNDGWDFGPDSYSPTSTSAIPYTQTSGVLESGNYTTSQGGGEIDILPGFYPINNPIVFDTPVYTGDHPGIPPIRIVGLSANANTTNKTSAGGAPILYPTSSFPKGNYLITFGNTTDEVSGPDIENLTLQCTENGVLTDQGTTSQNYSQGIQVIAGTVGLISNNSVYGSSGIGISVIGSGSGGFGGAGGTFKVINNTVTNSSGIAIQVYIGDAVVADNTIFYNFGFAIDAGGISGTGVGVIVVGNTVNATQSVPFSARGGALFVSNVVDGGLPIPSDLGAFVTYGGNNFFIGNFILAGMVGNSSTGQVITTEAPGYTVVSENYIVLASDNYLYVYFSSSSAYPSSDLTSVIFKNNHILLNGYSISQLSLNSTGSTAIAKISGTDFVDVPYPDITTPTVPASGTALQNTNPYAVKAYVQGGALTEIQVTIGSNTYTVYSNSTASAVYEGFTLPAGASITLTYTTAPTWSWVPE